jgi:hypothetical protein
VAKVDWKDEPEEHDYPASEAYLSLLLPADVIAATLTALRATPVTTHKAKDILRASGLPLLTPENAHVAADLEKIEKGKSLSPILLVRGDARIGTPLQIADGYHRVCASYHVDENTDIPCRLAGIPEG